MSWHCLEIVSDENPTVLLRVSENFRIRQACKASCFCGLKIEGGLLAAHRPQNKLIQIYVRLKPEGHERAVWRSCLIVAIRCAICGFLWRSVSFNVSNAASCSRRYVSTASRWAR